MIYYHYQELQNYTHMMTEQAPEDQNVLVTSEDIE